MPTTVAVTVTITHSEDELDAASSIAVTSCGQEAIEFRSWLAPPEVTKAMGLRRLKMFDAQPC